MQVFVECPQCKEVACVTKSSFTTTIDCKCGTVEMDTMIEGDRHYPVYNNFMSKYGATMSPVFTDEEGRLK